MCLAFQFRHSQQLDPGDAMYYNWYFSVAITVYNTFRFAVSLTNTTKNPFPKVLGAVHVTTLQLMVLHQSANFHRANILAPGWSRGARDVKLRLHKVIIIKFVLQSFSTQHYLCIPGVILCTCKLTCSETQVPGPDIAFNRAPNRL